MALTKVVGGVIADSSITSTDITDSTITNAKMAVDPSNASNLSSGDVPLAQLGNAPETDLTAQKGDIALLAFKTQANGNLARYNLVDQSVDAFEDASGISSADSTDAVRDSSGKYYSGGQALAPPTGGTSNTYSSYESRKFLTSGDFVTGSSGTIAVMLQAGGGAGGGNHHGGGGGGGGLIYKASHTLAAGTHAIVVGTGGVGAAAVKGANGNDSTAFGITAMGGGGGGFNGGVDGKPGGNGGGGGAQSGSGGSYTQTNNGGGTAAGNPGQSGGGAASGGSYGSGGGGGNGGNGAGTGGQGGGVGGAGYGGTGTDYETGSNITYGGGGGGASYSGGNGGAGGSGGGGQGGTYNTSNATDGTDGLGGGGGGAEGYAVAPGQSGGDGVVIIRFTAGTLGTPASYNDMILESNTITAQAAPTKGDLVFTYTNGAGTAVVGTNITAEYSADAGSTWTDFGIAAGDVQGTTGGHTIVTKNNVALTSTSGTSMRYRIKTLVQSVALTTRIHAVSLGWS